MPPPGMAGAPPLSRHARGRGSSGDPLSKPRVPVGAQESEEHDTGDLATYDLAVDEFSLVKAGPCLCLSIVWGQLTCGAQSSAPLWCIDRVHLAVRV